MAAKKKKTAVRRKPAVRRPAAPSAASSGLENTLKQIEERLGALEAKVSTPTDLGREIRAVLQPAVDTYRESVRARGDIGIQLPFVLAGMIVTILIVVAVLASSGSISGDAAAILLGGTLLYAVMRLRRLFLD